MNGERNPNDAGLCVACDENDRQRGCYCAPCWNAYMRARRHLGRDTAQQLRMSKDGRQALKAQWVEAKGGKCVRCGFLGDMPAKRAALHFHHAGRVFVFRMATAASRGADKVAAELAKCDLLCSNCHIVEHFHEAQRHPGRPRKPIDKRTQYFVDMIQRLSGVDVPIT